MQGPLTASTWASATVAVQNARTAEISCNFGITTPELTITKTSISRNIVSAICEALPIQIFRGGALLSTPHPKRKRGNRTDIGWRVQLPMRSKPRSI